MAIQLNSIWGNCLITSGSIVIAEIDASLTKCLIHLRDNLTVNLSINDTDKLLTEEEKENAKASINDAYNSIINHIASHKNSTIIELDSGVFIYIHRLQ